VDRVLRSKNQLVVSGVIGVALTYLLGSRAIYTGSYWQYLGTFLLLVLTVKLFVKAFNNGRR
jgi:hypothetical protein